MMEYFQCYFSYAKKTARLSDEQMGHLFRALIKYAETGERSELDPMEGMAFDFIADDIDRSAAKYANKCDTNKKSAMEAAEARAALLEAASGNNDPDPEPAPKRRRKVDQEAAAPEAAPDADASEAASDPVDGSNTRNALNALDQWVADTRKDFVAAEAAFEATREEVRSVSRSRKKMESERTPANASERQRTPAKDPKTKTKTKTKTISPNGEREARRFAPPSLQEVSLFIHDAGLDDRVSAAEFVSHYTTYGWRSAGGADMEDWRSAVKLWALRGTKWATARSGTRADGKAVDPQYSNDRLSHLEIDLSAEG